MIDGQSQCGDCPHGIAEDVGLLDPGRLHERGHIACKIGIGDRAVDIRGAAVPLKLQRVDPVGFGQPSDDLAQHGDGHVGAVQHDQRIAFAGYFIVHLHAVDLDAAAFGRLLSERGAAREECRGGK